MSTKLSTDDRLRQRVRQRGRARRAAGRPQQPAEGAPIGLYAELLSGTAFTAPRAENRRSWLYRRQPSAVVGGYERLRPAAVEDRRRRRRRRAARPAALAPDRRCRREPPDFVDGLRTLVANGDADAQTGIAAHLYLRQPLDGPARLRSTPTARCCSCRSRAASRITTELGVLDVAPGRDRAAAARHGLQGRGRRPVARLCLRELRRAVPPARARPDRLQRPGQCARLPGPGGRLRRRRRATTRLVKKYGGALLARDAASTSPFNVVAWHGNLAPLQVRHRALHDHRLDQLRPPRPVDLHRADLARATRRAPPTATS